jgi:hypothetical protein
MRRDRAASGALRLLAAGVICVCLPSTASALQSVRLQATFTPERLGHDTTVGFAFQIAASGNQVPSPLTGIEVSYPVDLGFALSELGLARCSAGALEAFGPQGCPANSLMGYGTALAEIAIGPSILRETVRVIVFRTTDHRGHLALLIYASGATPVSAEIVFPAVVFPAVAPFGGRLDMAIPLVPSLPEAPDVAVVQFTSTLGPQHLHYHERIHGRVVSFQPRGIPLPTSCPPGGFPFSAKFRFLDGSHAVAHTTVPCPHRMSRRRPAIGAA